MRFTLWLCGVLISTACTGGSSLKDGPDGGTPGVARIKVTDDGAALEGVRVAYHTADGEVAGLVRTDPSGVAEHPIEAGGLVTVAYPNEITLVESRLYLLTYSDVGPGDFLTIEIPAHPASYSPPPDPGPIAGQLEVELPPLEGAGHFEIHLGCIDYVTGDLVTVVDVPRSCLGSDDRIDLTAQAYTPPDLPARLGTTFARGVSVTPDAPGSVTLPEWIPEVPSIDVELSEIPTGATDAFASAVMLADGLAFKPSLADAAELSGDRATLSPGFFQAFADRVDLQVSVHAELGNITALSLLAAPVEPLTAVSGAELLPTVRDVAIDPTATRISWTATGDLGSADATFLHLRSERSEGVVRRLRRWTILAPPGSPSPFSLPELPPELDAYRPLPEDDYLDPGIVTFDADWIGGFQQFVADHGTVFLDQACVPEGHSMARLTRAGVFYGPSFGTSAY